MTIASGGQKSPPVKSNNGMNPPMVVTVEGETRRLTGTAAAQYESWRRLLKEIYEAETGFVDTGDATDADPVRVAEPTG